MNTGIQNSFFEDLEKGLRRNEYGLPLHMEIDRMEIVNTFSTMEATFHNVILVMRNSLNSHYKTYIASFFSSKK